MWGWGRERFENHWSGIHNNTTPPPIWAITTQHHHHQSGPYQYSTTQHTRYLNRLITLTDPIESTERELFLDSPGNPKTQRLQTQKLGYSSNPKKSKTPRKPKTRFLQIRILQESQKLDGSKLIHHPNPLRHLLVGSLSLLIFPPSLSRPQSPLPSFSLC